MWDEWRRKLGLGSDGLPAADGSLSARDVEAGLSDLRGLLATSRRQIDAGEAEEKRLATSEVELTRAIKELLASGDRVHAGERALELKKVRERLASERERLGRVRASHEKGLEIVRAYERAAAPLRKDAELQARAKEPERRPAEPPAAAVLRAIPEVTELARTAASAATRTLGWLRDLVETPAPLATGPGQAAFDSGEHDRAIDECNRALARDPSNAVALCNRGAARAMQNRPEEALADYDRALRIAPDHALTWSNRADAKLTLDDYAGAIADATEALERDPSLALARFNRGRAQASLGAWAEAAADFEAGLRLAPDHALLHAHLAVAKLALEEPEEAVRQASRALALDPALAFAYRARAQARLATGELPGALADIDAALERGERPGDRLFRARILEARGDTTAADAEIARSSDDPGLVRARWLVEAGELDRALRELEKAPEKATMLALRGEVLSQQGEHEGALTALTRAIELEPENASLLETRGRARFGAADHLGALEDAEAALALGHLDALDVRGFARWAIGDLAGARDDLSRALARTPSSSAAHEALGRVLVALGDRTRARASLERAVALEPLRFHALLWLVAVGGSPGKLDELAASGTWLAQLAKLVRGEASVESVLEVARVAETEHEVRERLCDAHAFAGYRAERAGDRARAIEHYEASLATGAEQASEHAWVRARLAIERQRAPLPDDLRLEKMAALGVLTPDELAQARKLLAPDR